MTTTLRTTTVTGATNKGSALTHAELDANFLHVPTSTATTRTAQSKLQEIISVKDFGAVGDGSTDDTAAFNRARAYLVTQVDSNSHAYVTIRVPPGRYSISSWNLTELAYYGVVIDMTGAELIANTASKHVIDGIGSSWLTIIGGVIYSPANIIAKSGIQLGPKGTETCGINRLIGVTIKGQFSFAPYMNLGSETTTHKDCIFRQEASGQKWAMIADGISTYLPTSDYATVTRSSGTGMSFTLNSFYGCQFLNTGGASGEGMYLAKTEQWEFDPGCYHASYGTCNVRIYGTTTWVHQHLRLCGTFETSSSPGVDYTVVLDNDGTSTTIIGFVLDVPSPQCGTALIRIASGTAALRKTEIRVQNVVESGATFFSGSGISMDGEIHTIDAASLNLGTLSAFRGFANVNDYTALASTPAAGLWRILDATNSIERIGAGSAVISLRGGSGVNVDTISQIAFPAAQNASSGANTLDDYEEGTFVPTLGVVSGTDGSQSYSTQIGRYRKVGKTVHIEIILILSAKDGTTSGSLAIKGLPFTVFVQSGYSVAQAVYRADLWDLNVAGGYYAVCAGAVTNGTTLNLFEQGDNVNAAALTEVDFTTTSGIRIAGNYEATA